MVAKYFEDFTLRFQDLNLRQNLLLTDFNKTTKNGENEIKFVFSSNKRKSTKIELLVIVLEGLLTCFVQPSVVKSDTIVLEEEEILIKELHKRILGRGSPFTESSATRHQPSTRIYVLTFNCIASKVGSFFDLMERKVQADTLD